MPPIPPIPGILPFRAVHAAHQLVHATFFTHFLHHFAHLLVLLDETVDVLNLGAGTGSNTLFAGTVHDVRIGSLSRSHGVDDGFHLDKDLVIHLALHLLAHTTHAGQFVHYAAQAAHLLHLLQLITEVFEVEALAFLQLAGQLVCFFAIKFAFCFLNEGENVTHAQNTGSNAIWIERLQGVCFFRPYP